MKSKKKNIIITSIGIILLLIAIVGASYAYFQASIGSGSTTPVTVEAGTIDSLVFDTGNPITLEANQDNFASGQGNRSGSTTASAILTANNQASSAVTYTYNVYLNITENTYVKTGSSAELVLRVTDPNTGNLVSIPDLTQVTVGGVTGYDITEEDGLITIASNYAISTSTTKTDTWNIYVYFVNLGTDQSDNAGAYFEGLIQITRETYATTAFTENCSAGQALNNCIVSTYTTDGANNLYYHSVGKTLSAEDGSYRYAGGPASDTSPYYYITAEHNGGTASSIFNLRYNDQLLQAMTLMVQRGLITVSGEYNNIINVTNGGQYDISNDEEKTLAIYDMISLGYIVPREGTEPNNYICFSLNNGVCDYDSLYRIIGVIPVTLSDNTTQNLVKVIKADYANSNVLGTGGGYSGSYAVQSPWLTYRGSKTNVDAYYLNQSNSVTINNIPTLNLWSNSPLNTNNFMYYIYDYLSSDLMNLIAFVKWQVGGNTQDIFDAYDENTNERTGNAKTTYTNEIVSPNPGTCGNNTYTNLGRIGLMYMSDYAYANSDWTARISSSEIGANNWLNLGYDEWTITRDASVYLYTSDNENPSCKDMYSIANGYLFPRVLDGSSQTESSMIAVRPAFYLVGTTTYQSGSGTYSDPIRIN